MIDQIKKIVEQNKNFASIISRNAELIDFLKKETSFLSVDAKTSERIYVLLNNTRPECQYGNYRKFLGINDGYGKCGRATKCRCARENMSAKISSASKSKDWEEIKKKREATNIKKYGVAHNSQIDAVKEKKEQTCFKKYGTKTNLQCDETKEKIKQTINDRYGTDNPMKNTAIKDKSHAILKERYGDVSPFSSSRRDEFTEIMVDKYGTEHALQNKDIMSRRTKTTMERFGVKYAAQHDDVKQKIRNTTIKNYGVPHFKQKHLTLDVVTFLDDENRFKTEFDNIGFHGIRLKYGVSSQIVRSRCKQYDIEYDLNLTSPESFIYEILRSNIDRGNIKVRDRTVIKPLELDFYLPDYQIAIEVCGLYWHSQKSGGKQYSYHQNKMYLCEEQNVRLITIFEDEIEQNPSIVQDRINHILGFGKRTCYARETFIKEIEVDEYRDFVNEYHIQGYTPSKIKYGAYFKNELVGVMSFGKKRHFMGKGETFELLRFCSNGSVPGLASKILKRFLKEYETSQIISYCDRRWGTGKLYEQLGFEYQHTSKPNYWYMKHHVYREYRYKYAKHKLVSEGFDENKSEWEIMQERGYDRIWDCGSDLYVLNNST